MRDVLLKIMVLVLIVGPIVATLNAEAEAKKDYIQQLRDNPNAISLESDNPMLDVRKMRRDPNNNPRREPGPINIQKTLVGTWNTGIPTFLRLPMALGPEDLKAGGVEVAFFGASVDISTGFPRLSGIR